MSKIRIYELAKELGVDNKVVISRAIELGLRGKSSHSHSLDADEADQIRRAIIRQAMGAPKSSNSEVVTTRVDRTTGTTEAVVERRQGDVIRRRRAADAPGESAAGQTASASHSESPAIHDQSAGVSMSDGGAARDWAPEPAIAEAEPDLEHEDVLPEEVDEAGIEAADATEVVEEVAVAEEQEEEVFEEEAALEDAVGVPESTEETAPVAAVQAPQAESAALQAVSAPQPLPPRKLSTKVFVPQTAAPQVGPKILGKIELPQRRVIVRPIEAPKRTGVVGKPGVGPVAPVREAVTEEEDGRKKGFKKGRKREISSVDLVDYAGRENRRGKPGRGGRGDEDRRGMVMPETERPRVKRVIELGDSITVGELARQMSLKAGEVIAKLLGLGVLATINQAIDKDTAQIVADDLGYEIKHVEFNEQTILQNVVEEDAALLQPRPPVVTVMGHVDHGKTSLLDRIRQAAVAAKEAGGITQHIGAYSVKTGEGKSVTFIDTPGHAAFTSMRARGAQVTDIVVLVVAADDGVMPQTREAINHAKAAKVPIIVAVNKMDRPDANPDRVKQQLSELGLQPEDWGGDTMYYPISALKGDGITELLEGIAVLADVRELKANPDRRAKGAIIESRQDRGRGVVATVLVQAGKLAVGDIFVSGSEYGRVRTMSDHTGTRVEVAGPSVPVEITGLNGMPEAGDDFMVVDNEADAREVASNRAQKKQQEERALASGPISLEEFSKRANNTAAQELNVILKADVQGSVEAVKEAIEKLSGDKVKVRVLHSAVGGVNESDIQLAVASKAIVIGFGVRAEPRAATDAERLGIEIRFYRIIYELLDDVKSAMVGLLDPIRQEVNLGRVEVRDTFTIPKAGTVAGCYVTGGTVKRSAHVRLLRDNRVIHEGKMSSLRRFKDDVREVQAGFECGIGIENFNDVKIGDVIDVYEFKEIAATLD